ncbi:MAG: FmdB family transcriptional regulator [Actinomycetota bacterium]|nr:FmdB family transcriptional regulator [Actinomycetota bacterium]
MPTYEYLCRACGHGFDIVQAFADDTLTICPACGGELRKIFAAPTITFKGSGFYATDNRKGTKGGERSDGSKESKESKDSKGSKDPKDSAGSKDTKSSGSSGSKSTEKKTESPAAPKKESPAR